MRLVFAVGAMTERGAEVWQLHEDAVNAWKDTVSARNGSIEEHDVAIEKATEADAELRDALRDLS